MVGLGVLMPIYTYECQKCGHRFDAYDRYSDPMERECEQEHPDRGAKCDGIAVRVPSVASFKFNCSMPTYQKKKT